jgi:photosystem II stability/assembly factor-like uncharacterized protein
MQRQKLSTLPPSGRSRMFVIVLAVFAYSAACDPPVTSTSRSGPEGSALVVLRPIPAVIGERGRVTIDHSASVIDNTIDLTGSLFVNARKGWVFGPTALFVTSDSAKSWTRLRVDLPEDCRLSAAFFNDENRGWLARNLRSSAEPYGLGNSATILATFDGGVSWLEQASFRDGVQINGLKFLNGHQGFALGYRVKDHKPRYNEVFVAKTVDGGKTWTDISEKLRPSLDNGAGFMVGEGRDLLWLSATNILLLISPEGRIISTSDGGENWNTLTRFQDQRPSGYISSTSYYKLLIDQAYQTRIIAGAMGDEGYWGDLVVQSDRENWSSYELRGIPILDALFLAPDEILACGMEFRRTEDNQPRPPVGVILYSSDTGKNWTPLYRSPRQDSFVSLSRVGSNQFYALSKNGTVLRFALNTSTSAQVQKP